MNWTEAASIFAIIIARSIFATESPTFEVTKIEDQTIHFSNELNSLDTKLHRIKVLGIAEQNSKIPTILLEASPCKECENEKSIYFIKADGSKIAQYVYPGKIRNDRTKNLEYTSNAYFGECLKETEQIYVVFQKEKIDRRSKLQSSVLVAKPNQHGIAEELIVNWRRRPAEYYVKNRVKKGKCQEIAGLDRVTLDAFPTPKTK